MFEQAVRPDTLALLDRLVGDAILEGWYLGGGTAVALHLGHRLSEDLDFFTGEQEGVEGVNAYLAAKGARILKKTAGSLTASLEGVRASFITYPYPLLEEPATFRGCAIAGLKDLALMKITAIADRGKRKDFVDLYVLCRAGLSLTELLETDMRRKFRGVAFSLVHYVKSLVYFADADADEEPLHWLRPVPWEEVKRFFRAEIKKVDVAGLGNSPSL